MEKHAHSFDVCVVCALPEEVTAFLEVMQPRCESAIEECSSPRYQYSYRFATMKNDKEEPLNLHISWLPRYGSQEMALHLSRVLEECQPRIAIMTGICAGDAQCVQLGDLVVAERTFTYDNGKFTLDEHGRSVHEHDAMTYQLDANILQFLRLFDDWKPLIARLERPPYPHESRLKQRKVHCHIKAMASGSAVRADNPFEDVRTPVHGTVAIDMEGAAFGLVMSRHPLIPWLVVKGVCDYADRDKNDAYHDYTARASALYALSFIQAYVTNEKLPRLNFPHVAIPQQPISPPPSSRQPLKLLPFLFLFLFVVATGGVFWFWTAHSWAPQQSSHQHQGTPYVTTQAQTPSITPTSTTVSSLSPETKLAMAESAPIIYDDAMNNPDNQGTAAAAWDITTQCSFSSNGYRTSTYQSKPAFCHERNNTYQDAFISVDVVIVSGSSAGLLFRDQFFSNAHGAYFFEIGSNGQYKISIIPFAVQSTLQNWTQAPAIHSGRGVKNTLQVIAQGNTLSFYINGTFLTVKTDGRYTKGNISFACYTGSSSRTEATFSNLKVHKLS